MAYVYAVVFDGNIVKFGRSIDPWKRISNHVSDGKRYDQSAILAFVSQVQDCVKAESELIVEASWVMDEISQESFKFKEISEIASCFRAIRLEYMVFKVANDPYRLSVYPDTFKFDDSNFTKADLVSDPLEKIKRGIAVSISCSDGLSFDTIKAGNVTRRVSDLKVCLLEMEKSGHIIIDRWRNPFNGIPINDMGKAKFRVTDKLYEYLH